MAAHVPQEEKEGRKAWHACFVQKWGTWPGAGYCWLLDDAIAPPPPPPPPVVFLAQADGAERPRDRQHVVGGMGPHHAQVCGGPSAVPGGLHCEVWAPLAQNSNASLLADGGGGPPQATAGHVPLLRGVGLLGLAQHVVTGGPGPGLVGPASLAGGGQGQRPGSSPRGTRPETQGRGLPGHLLADGHVHGLLAMGRDPAAGCPAFAGGMNPPQGLWLPPLPGDNRWGGGHGRPLGAGSAEALENGRPGFRLCQVH